MKRFCDGFVTKRALSILTFLVLAAMVAVAGCLPCPPCPPCECLEEKQAISQLEAENAQLEAQLPCPVIDCPVIECPVIDCPDCSCPPCPTPSAEEFKNLLDLKNWLAQDTTDESWVIDRDRTRIARDLQKAALADGYIISVYPYKSTGCPPKHYLLNFAVIRGYLYSIDASTDEVIRYLGI